MKRLLPAILLFCFAMPSQAQRTPVKAIDTTTLTNGKTIVVYSNKTWKYIERPVVAAIVNTYYSPSQEQSTDPVTTTRSATRTTHTPATTSHQCHATTQKGAQCRRMVINGYNCWQHGG